MPAPNSIDDFWRQVDKSGECWIWIGAFPGGKNGGRYGRFGYEGRKHAAHRFSYFLAYGPIPEGAHVLHRCDRTQCVNPDHLFLGTHKDNMRDRTAKGRETPSPGSKNGFAKLTEATVIEIRARHRRGVTQVDLAAQFHVNQTTISKIVLRQTWRHI